MISKCIGIYTRQIHTFAVSIYRTEESRDLNFALLQIQFSKVVYWMQFLINEIKHIPEGYMFEQDNQDFIDESDIHVFTEMLEELETELKEAV